MSASLVGLLDIPQCLMDDLESTLYVLLWITIMYSPCSDSSIILGFLDHTLDPQVMAKTRYLEKLYFLENGAFFDNVKFVG